MESVESSRVHRINNLGFADGKYVLYWMQSARRVKNNPSFNYSSEIANMLDIPLLVFYGIGECGHEITARHLKFLLEGLDEVRDELAKRKIKMVIWLIDPVSGTINLSQNASAVITDFQYLKKQRELISRASELLNCRFDAVESDLIVPVGAASVKEEYSAGTFRPKIMKILNLYLTQMPELSIKNSSLESSLKGIDPGNYDKIISEIKADKSVKTSDKIIGGERAALNCLNRFIKTGLDGYGEKRNDPGTGFTSSLSPYLHYGYISPVYAALKVLDSDSPGTDSFLEEMIIRRELSFNFVYYNRNYDSIQSLPGWAMNTLILHTEDTRETVYSSIELENADTHDIYWNAAQRELVTSGQMHNYMRMYWGKKIIEWTESPDVAFRYMIYLNNRYALDGSDPNSYAGIAWCFGKHDRAWKERRIFGKVRYMNENGLKRKFDMEKYLSRYGKG